MTSRFFWTAFMLGLFVGIFAQWIVAIIALNPWLAVVIALIAVLRQFSQNRKDRENVTRISD